MSMMPSLAVSNGWQSWTESPARERLESEVLPGFLGGRRWFAGKARSLEGVRIIDVSTEPALPSSLAFTLLEARFGDGGRETYVLPLAVSTGEGASRIASEPALFVCELTGPGGSAVLHDGLAS